MKRIITIMLTVALALSLAACGRKGGEKEPARAPNGTVCNSISFSDVYDEGDSVGTIHLIVSLDDMEARRLQGTFTVDITDNSKVSANFLVEIDRDGGSSKLGRPTHQRFEWTAESRKLSEIRRVDDSKVAMIFAGSN